MEQKEHDRLRQLVDATQVENDVLWQQLKNCLEELDGLKKQVLSLTKQQLVKTPLSSNSSEGEA